MKKVFLTALVLILTLANLTPAFAASDYKELKSIPITSDTEAPSVQAESAILINAETGDIIFQKNMHEKLYPASITKLMTVLLALEKGDPNGSLVFSRDAVFSIERNSNHIACDVGEELPFIDALYAILLESANEVSNAMAEYISGSMDDFAELMTQRAKELGCKNTHFVNANGLHNDEHYTTAYDMALIAKELIKYDVFSEIATTTYYEIAPTNIQPEIRYMHMQNKMVIPSSNYYYEYCTGGKTGFTDQALNTLVTFAEKDGMKLICVVLKDNGAATYTDSIALFNYGFDNYKSVSLFSAEGYETTIKVESNDELSVTLKAAGDFAVTIPKETNISSVEKKLSCPDTVSEAKAGEAVGNIKFILGDLELGKVDLIAQNSIRTGEAVSKPIGSMLIDFLIVLIIIVIAAFIIFIIFVAVRREIRYRRRKRKRRRRLQQLKNQNIKEFR